MHLSGTAEFAEALEDSAGDLLDAAIRIETETNLAMLCVLAVSIPTETSRPFFVARPLCVEVRPDYPGNPLNPHTGGERLKRLSAWLLDLLKRKSPKLAAVALASMTARIAWKMMLTGEIYSAKPAAAASVGVA